MKRLFLASSFVFFCFFLANAKTNVSNDTIAYNRKIVDQHRQFNDLSAIPSGIEMILKLNKKVPANFFDYQKIWGRNDGNFVNFDSIAINGIRFYQKFNIVRNKNFPFNDLYKTIDQELAEKRFVLISLPTEVSWFIFVIYGKQPNGDYLAFSKHGKKTIKETRIKELAERINGTDIMIYRDE